MRGLVKIAVAGSMLLASYSVFAQDEEAPEYGWTGIGEFGLVNTTGNTESTALNLKLEFVKTSENWRHRFTGAALMTENNDVKDNERYSLEAQSDRKLSDVSYVFGTLRWETDKFGAYDPQQSAVVGYGRQLIKTDTHELKGEIGAGYRKLEDRVTGETSSDAIVRFLLDDSWQVLPSTLWTNRLLVESGSDNTFTQFKTAAAVAMTNAFALKLGLEVRNNSTVPAGTKKTDTVTTINLVYNF